MWAERWAIGRGCRDSAKFFFHLHPSNSLMSLHLHCVDARQIWQQSRSELEVGTDSDTGDTPPRALLPGFVAHAHKTVELEVVIAQLELESRVKVSYILQGGSQHLDGNSRSGRRERQALAQSTGH